MPKAPESSFVGEAVSTDMRALSTTSLSMTMLSAEPVASWMPAALPVTTLPSMRFDRPVTRMPAHEQERASSPVMTTNDPLTSTQFVALVNTGRAPVPYGATVIGCAAVPLAPIPKVPVHVDPRASKMWSPGFSATELSGASVRHGAAAVVPALPSLPRTESRWYCVELPLGIVVVVVGGDMVVVVVDDDVVVVDVLVVVELLVVVVVTSYWTTS